MRLWLKDSERRPDPAPVKTDDRLAFLAGLVAWVVGLGVLLVLGITRSEPWYLWTCAAGIVLGVAGVIYAQVRHLR